MFLVKIVLIIIIKKFSVFINEEVVGLINFILNVFVIIYRLYFFKL